SVDHWLAFGLLAFIGGKMVKESFEENDEAHPHFNPSRLRTQLMLSIATSIDALAVGISFGCLGYTSLSSIALPLFVIGLVSFLFAIAGHLLGIRFGKTITRRLKPELFGGIVLLAIGIKILITHLFFNP
ncbi:MAG: manganese efflux pump MntP family protein, partial [Prevotella sp.]